MSSAIKISCQMFLGNFLNQSQTLSTCDYIVSLTSLLSINLTPLTSFCFSCFMNEFFVSSCAHEWNGRRKEIKMLRKDFFWVYCFKERFFYFSLFSHSFIHCSISYVRKLENFIFWGNMKEISINLLLPANPFRF